MGCYCNVFVAVDGIQQARVHEIIEALADWTDGDSWSQVERSGEVSLEYDKNQNLNWGCFSGLWDGPGRDEIAHEIWKANGASCDVTVSITNLEAAPSESGDYGDEDYQEWKETQQMELTQEEWDELTDEGKCRFMEVNDVATAMQMWEGSQPQEVKQ